MSKREGNYTPGRRGLSAPGAARLRVLLLVAIVVIAGAIYEAGRCYGPWGERPAFGTFTIHCEWRGRTVRSLNICEYMTDRRPRFDPLSRALINHMAWKAAMAELNHVGSAETAAEIDVRVFGTVLPCGMEVLATEFTNPSVVSLKPRGTGRRPGRPGARPL
ncbi:MAG: hypothetical protein ABSF71_40625 [Terriglobia bacterium]